MLSSESRRNKRFLQLPTLMFCSLKSISLQKFETPRKKERKTNTYRRSWWRQWDNRKSCGETNFVHIFIPSVHFKQKSEVSAQKLSSQRLQRLFPILHEKGSFYSRTAIRSKQTIMLTFNKVICFGFHRLHLSEDGSVRLAKNWEKLKGSG